MRLALMRTLAAVTWLAACGGDDGGGAASTADAGGQQTDARDDPADASSPVAICDGSDELRLAALFGGSWYRFIASETGIANGNPFVYVNGNCRYWTSGHDGQALTGTLDDAAEERLTSQLGVATWPSFYDGNWRGLLADAPPLLLWEPAGRVECHDQCEGGNVPRQLTTIGDRLLAENELLRAEGQPLDGPMRAMAIESPLDSFPTEAPVFDWVYDPPIADFTGPQDGGTDGVVPGLIEDPEAVAALRRAWLESQELGDYFLTVRDEDGVTYRLWARDVLPFEADDGHGVDLPE